MIQISRGTPCTQLPSSEVGDASVPAGSEKEMTQKRKGDEMRKGNEASSPINGMEISLSSSPMTSHTSRAASTDTQALVPICPL
ncbi:hypothetical protein CPB86DRAFT_781574, partial [Serendipita vermifera]